jgi:hypothetical protein
MQRVADAASVVYAPNLSAAVATLRRLAEALARVAIEDDPRADRESGTDLARLAAPGRGIASDPGVRLAALRTGDGAADHTLFVAVPAARARTGSSRAFAPKILDAAAFVATAERALHGLSRQTWG